MCIVFVQNNRNGEQSHHTHYKITAKYSKVALLYQFHCSIFLPLFCGRVDLSISHGLSRGRFERKRRKLRENERKEGRKEDEGVRINRANNAYFSSFSINKHMQKRLSISLGRHSHALTRIRGGFKCIDYTLQLAHFTATLIASMKWNNYICSYK